MPNKNFIQTLQLPELKVLKSCKTGKLRREFFLQKVSEFEVCPKCATPSKTIYDHVNVHIKDTPIRDKRITLNISKRRFFCKSCKKPFTEPVQGIRKGFRTTDRFRKHIMWCADNFANLSDVRKQLDVSSWLVYKAYYEQLETQIRKNQNPWATTIGIDEHAIRRNKTKSYREFGTIFVEYSHKRIRELVIGRSPGELFADERLRKIPGRENVRNVVIDLSKNYRRFVLDFFPNAQIIADRFHVIRLFNNILNKYRLEVTGDKRKNPVRKLILKKSKDLDFFTRKAIYRWLDLHPKIKEAYFFKEAIHAFYNIKGTKYASKRLIKLTDAMALSTLSEIQTLRRTLVNWHSQIVNFFENRITNGRTEGFNRVAKLIQRNAYGFKNIENYRRRLLYQTS